MAAFSLEYTIDVDEKTAVVYAKVYGIWTEKTAWSYHEDFKEEVEPLLGKPWAKIIDLSKWRTSYEQVTGAIGEHMKWSKENGAKLQIYVLNNPSTFRQLNQMFTKGKAEDISKTFRTFEEAVTYLRENWEPAKQKNNSPRL